MQVLPQILFQASEYNFDAVRRNLILRFLELTVKEFAKNKYLDNLQFS